jgi:hypothetical protein
VTASAAPALAPAGLYQDIQQFYAQQMQALDEGATSEWAATFTPDGEFAAGGLPEPVRGRDAIAAGAAVIAADFAGRGVQRRHWLGMLAVAPEPGGSVRARAYALVLEIPPGGEVAVQRSTVCDDELVPAGGGWLVRRRRVTRDGLD